MPRVSPAAEPPSAIASAPAASAPLVQEPIGRSPYPPDVVPTRAPAKRGGLGLLAVFVVVLVAAGGGFFAYRHFTGATGESAGRTAGAADAGTNVVAIKPALSDANAAAAKDAGAAATSDDGGGAFLAFDAAVGETETVADAAAVETVAAVDGKLVITSTPSGATVYFDGAEVGETPVELDASGDKHRLALILSGHALHVADIDGNTSVDVKLEAVTTPGGSAGIKVRCKKKNRYYVTVDGKPSGMLCPTERIGTQKGKHTVEIYDPINDSNRSFDIDIKHTRHSHRLYID